MQTYDMGTALNGIRRTAKSRPGANFTPPMHHIYAVDRLRAAYFALKRAAAAGVDDQTWQSYGQDLEARLVNLSDRLTRGGYRPQPVRRVYIDKADGSRMPLGVPALEDKLGQPAAVETCSMRFYEQDFLGYMIMVRYADGWVAEFQCLDDAARFQRAVAERLAQFGLALHGSKTRLIEF